MKLNFKHKVFLTLLLNSLAIVISMLLIAGYYASRNFEKYVTKVETKKLGELADLLSREYERNGSWEPLLDDLGHWLQMVGIGPGRPPGGEMVGEPPPPPPLLVPDPRLMRKSRREQPPPWADPRSTAPDSPGPPKTRTTAHSPLRR